jgi:hypothetical protein
MSPQADFPPPLHYEPPSGSGCPERGVPHLHMLRPEGSATSCVTVREARENRVSLILLLHLTRVGSALRTCAGETAHAAQLMMCRHPARH